MYSDALIAPWLDLAVEPLTPLDLFDAHTHVGVEDPSGFSGLLSELTDSLDRAGAAAAVFPLKEPGGYAEPNRRLIESAAESDGALVAFARLDPADSPLELAEQGVSLGARGLKLHPEGEEFDLGDQRLEGVFAFADAERLPIVIHSDATDHGVGRTALEIAEAHPNARLILAHGGLPDLGWLWREVPSHPNLFFDTSWWSHSELMAMFAVLPPCQVLAASDFPYCSPISGMLAALRCSAQAGLDPDEIHGVVGGQFRRLVERRDPLSPGPVHTPQPLDPLAERAYVFLMTALEPMQRGEEPGEALDLARAACRTQGSESDEALAAVDALLTLYEDLGSKLPQRNQFAPGWDLISIAALVARTPAVPVLSPDRIAAEAAIG
jgi:predicted TIM-barrel fold metal-dependent hydrolase